MRYGDLRTYLALKGKFIFNWAMSCYESETEVKGHNLIHSVAENWLKLLK